MENVNVIISPEIYYSAYQHILIDKIIGLQNLWINCDIVLELDEVLLCTLSE